MVYALLEGNEENEEGQRDFGQLGSAMVLLQPADMHMDWGWVVVWGCTRPVTMLVMCSFSVISGSGLTMVQQVWIFALGARSSNTDLGSAFQPSVLMWPLQLSLLRQFFCSKVSLRVLWMMILPLTQLWNLWKLGAGEHKILWYLKPRSMIFCHAHINYRVMLLTPNGRKSWELGVWPQFTGRISRWAYVELGIRGGTPSIATVVLLISGLASCDQGMQRGWPSLWNAFTSHRSSAQSVWIAIPQSEQ